MNGKALSPNIIPGMTMSPTFSTASEQRAGYLGQILVDCNRVASWQLPGMPALAHINWPLPLTIVINTIE